MNKVSDIFFMCFTGSNSKCHVERLEKKGLCGIICSKVNGRSSEALDFEEFDEKLNSRNVTFLEFESKPTAPIPHPRSGNDTISKYKHRKKRSPRRQLINIACRTNSFPLKATQSSPSSSWVDSVAVDSSMFLPPVYRQDSSGVNVIHQTAKARRTDTVADNVRRHNSSSINSRNLSEIRMIYDKGQEERARAEAKNKSKIGTKDGIFRRSDIDAPTPPSFEFDVSDNAFSSSLVQPIFESDNIKFHDWKLGMNQQQYETATNPKILLKSLSINDEKTSLDGMYHDFDQCSRFPASRNFQRIHKKAQQDRLPELQAFGSSESSLDSNRPFF
mmetsp:Transcript_4632/g.6829  ORF Transcript_4632/g.6829 Transcript_4632/m.6829 type:complete len:331 (-) Transcript_4632:154-1146(-)